MASEVTAMAQSGPFFYALRVLLKKGVPTLGVNQLRHELSAHGGWFFGLSNRRWHAAYHRWGTSHNNNRATVYPASREVVKVRDARKKKRGR